MPFIARYGFLLLVLVFCGCFHLNIALLVVAFCWYEKQRRATKGKKSPNGNQASGKDANMYSLHKIYGLVEFLGSKRTIQSPGLPAGIKIIKAMNFYKILLKALKTAWYFREKKLKNRGGNSVVFIIGRFFLCYA